MMGGRSVGRLFQWVLGVVDALLVEDVLVAVVCVVWRVSCSKSGVVSCQ